MNSVPEIDIEDASDDISDVKIWDIPVFVIFVSLIVVVALQFFTRYVLNNSLSWTEEIARYLLILLGFVGSITCFRKGSHIFLEFFYRFLPAWFLKPLSMAVELINALFFGYLSLLGFQLASKTSAQKMSSIDFPKWVFYDIVAICCLIMACYATLHFFQLSRRDAESIAAEKLDI